MAQAADLHIAEREKEKAGNVSRLRMPFAEAGEAAGRLMRGLAERSWQSYEQNSFGMPSSMLKRPAAWEQVQDLPGASNGGPPRPGQDVPMAPPLFSLPNLQGLFPPTSAMLANPPRTHSFNGINTFPSSTQSGEGQVYKNVPTEPTLLPQSGSMGSLMHQTPGEGAQVRPGESSSLRFAPLDLELWRRMNTSAVPSAFGGNVPFSWQANAEKLHDISARMSMTTSSSGRMDHNTSKERDADSKSSGDSSLNGISIDSSQSRTSNEQALRSIMPGRSKISKEGINAQISQAVQMALQLQRELAGAQKVGSYTWEQRRQLIQRFRAKRAARKFTNNSYFAKRKSIADSRPRIHGRFMKREEKAEYDKSRSQPSERLQRKTEISA